MEERATNLPLSREELKKLLVDLEKRTGMHSMLNIILSSGMSLDDALSIRLADINYGNNNIKLFDRYLGRHRTIILPIRVMGLISLHQNGHNAPKLKLYEIGETTAIYNLQELSQERLGHPLTWSAIRRTWAVLAFDAKVSFKSMVETSGASEHQLAIWQFFKRDVSQIDSSYDLLGEFYSQQKLTGK